MDKDIEQFGGTFIIDVKNADKIFVGQYMS